MTARYFYRKRPVLTNFNDWVEREFEEVERVLANELTCYKWDDLSFPALAINPAGAAVPASVDNTDGTLIFSGTVDNAIAIVAQMPHSWVDGTAIRPHIHLQFKTSANANTRWKLEWDIANVNGDFGGFTAEKSETVTMANPQNVNKHAIKAWSEIAMTGFKDSAIVKFKITRLANSDAADNDTNAANLVSFDVHYQRNAHGSFDEYPT